MKQLVCPSCAAVLQRPDSRDECTITCFLCGKSLRLARRSSDEDHGVPAGQAAVTSPQRVASVAAARGSLPSASPGKVRQAAARIQTQPAAPQVRVKPAASSQPPASRSRRRWIAASLLLLVVGWFGVWLAFALFAPPNPPVADNEASTVEAAVEDNAPAAPAERNNEPRPNEPAAERPQPAHGPVGPVAEAQVRETVQINSRGDGAFVRSYHFSVQEYAVVKSLFDNINVVRRDLGFRQHWQEIQDFRVNFKDANSAVEVCWTVHGLARLGTDKQLWEAPLADERELSLISSLQHEGVFSGKIATRIGPNELLLPLTRIVRGPQGSSDVQLLAGPARIGFRMPAAAASGAGGNGEPRLEFECKPREMACVGQVYGETKFARWWTARTVLKNKSSQALRDYTVRFRLDGYAPNWKEFSCPVVVPGQTVVDAYFPLLDNKKLVEESGDCQTRLEVEYQFRQADGQVVQKKENRLVRILSRNQVMRTSLAPQECLDFFDARSDYPEILASLVTKDDKLIEEMAGRISRRVSAPGAGREAVLDLIQRYNPDRAGAVAGAAVAIDPIHTYRFMRGLYYFMANYIRYTTPGGDLFDAGFSQTVKYGRDVLKNKAGTCIDLSILYGSVCLAAGVEPTLVLIPGHCFVVIRLPHPLRVPVLNNNGQIVADEKGNVELIALQYLGVETTRIGAKSFEAAWAEGTITYLKSKKEGKSILPVDIAKEKARGVRSLSFPAASLKDIGIDDDDEQWAGHLSGGGSNPGGRPQAGGPGQGGPPPGGRRQGGGFMPNSAEAERPAETPTGKWFADGQFPDGTSYEYTLHLGKDGKYKLLQKLMKSMPRGGFAQPVQNEVIGTYKVGPESLIFTTDANEEQVCRFRLNPNQLYVSMNHPQYRRIHFNFTRLPD